MRAHRDGSNVTLVERLGAANGIKVSPADEPLLRSKLIVPPVPSTFVTRPRLHTLLDRGAAAKVTLVSAPAGWGKTVLLSSWIQSRDADERVAWLSIEPGDDASHLRSYLHTCIGPTEPNLR